jgi:hypothetical protein
MRFKQDKGHNSIYTRYFIPHRKHLFLKSSQHQNFFPANLFRYVRAECSIDESRVYGQILK